MKVSLIQSTVDGEKIIAYCARVSSSNQDNPEYEKLLTYCIDHHHWSVFEQADMTLEVTTSRAIAAQILRHRSFCFQEMSQRYTEAIELEYCEARRQDKKNRQNSIDDLIPVVKSRFLDDQRYIWNKAYALYQQAIDAGIAKECARMLLPLGTQTRLYMKGNVRSWIHYFQVRCAPETQKEHRDIANAGLTIFCEQFPIIGKLTKEMIDAT